jgi:hypothetical protein
LSAGPEDGEHSRHKVHQGHLVVVVGGKEPHGVEGNLPWCTKRMAYLRPCVRVRERERVRVRVRLCVCA